MINTLPACFFISNYGNGGSLSQEFQALGEELVRRGHRVIFLIHNKCKGMNEDHTSNPAVYKWSERTPSKWKDAVFLMKLIKQHNPKALIANFEAVNLMTLVGWFLKIPVRIAWYHTHSLTHKYDSKVPNLKLKLLYLRKMLLYKFATNITAVSQSAAQDAHEVFGVPQSKVNVLFNSIADPALKYPLKAYSKESHKIVCVARFDISKGQDCVIRAAHLLKKRVSQFQIIFIGGGKQRQKCEDLVKELKLEENCRFLGEMNLQEIFEQLASASMAIVPSRAEAFGYTNIEAMAAALPVVASRVGGIPEIITDGFNGFLVPPDNPEQLADRIQELFENPDLKNRLSANARRSFVERFEQHNVIQKKADWLEQLLI